MNKLIVTISLGFAVLANGTPVLANEDLAKSSGCLKCHDMNKKKIGPAFKVSAAELKKTGATADKVADAIKAKHKPKDMKAKDADLKPLADWILSL